MRLVVPPALPPAAVFGLITPGSPADRRVVAEGVRWLERQGFGWSATARDGARRPASKDVLHAGNPRARARELHRAWEEPEVDGLLCVRGGVGCLGVLPHLDFERLAARPRWLLGMSDVTALQLALWARTGIASLSCAMPVQLTPPVARETTRSWIAATRGLGSAHSPRIDGLRVLRGGRAEGPLVPANLSLLSRLIGTPYLPSLRGCILVLEDIHESRQSIDRMLSHLDLAGISSDLAGIVLAQFTQCGPSGRARAGTPSAADLLATWAAGLGVPALAGYPYGHERRTRALPLGVEARLRTRPAELFWDDFAAFAH